MAPPRKPPIEKHCPVCGKSFLAGGRGNRPKKQVYCSQRCNALARTRQPDIAKLTRDQRLYLAGIFDGEGSIIMWGRGYGGRPQLRCTVANTDLKLLDWIQAATGTGSIVAHQRKSMASSSIVAWKPTHKTSYYWQCYGQNAVALLRQLLPFLIVKRERAIEAIASQEVPTRTR